MSKCIYCGFEYSKGQMFCLNCGSAIEDTEQNQTMVQNESTQDNQQSNVMGVSQGYQQPDMMGVSQGYQQPNVAGVSQGYQQPNVAGVSQGYQQPNMMGQPQNYQQPYQTWQNQGYQQQGVWTPPNQPAPKKKGHGCLVAFLIILAVLMLISGGLFFLFNYVKNKVNNKIEEVKKENPLLEYVLDGINELNQEYSQNDNYQEIVKEYSQEPNSWDKISLAYEKGEINADKYAQQLLYYMYDNTRIDEAFASSNNAPTTAPEIAYFMEEHFDEISDETKMYYLEQISLPNVTFEVEDEETSRNSDNYFDPFCTTVHAAEDIVNLNQVAVSDNERFVVWYTTKGASAITKEQAQQIVDKLEKTTYTYDSVFGTSYLFKKEYADKNSERWKNQAKILKNNGYDDKLLDASMQVYAFDEPKSSFCAWYTHVNYKIAGHFKTARKSTEPPIYPYIVVQSKKLSNTGNIEQLVNHELFHHYQKNVFNDITPNADDYLYEASANWASALASDQQITEQYLNKWAGVFAKFGDVLTSYYESQAGKNKVRYAHFVYLDAYQNNVENGTQKIIDAIYDKDSYHKMTVIDATNNELNNISEYLAYKVLSRDYSNKNYVAVDSFYDQLPIIKIEGTDDKLMSDMPLSHMCMKYYDFSAAKYEVSIKKTAAESKLNVFVITKTGDKYEVVDRGIVASTKQEVVFSGKDYGNYDNIYLCVVNGSLLKEDDTAYTVNFKYLEDAKSEEVSAKESNDDTTKYYKEDFVFETDFDNYNVEITTVLDVAGFKTTTVSSGTVDQRHQKEYLTSSTKVLGMSVNYDVYVDFEKGISYTQVPFEGSWVKSEDGAQVVELGAVMDQFKDIGNVKEISPGCYEVKIPSKALAGSANTSNSEQELILGDGDVTAMVYISNGYITKMEYNFGDMIPGINAMDITILFTNYNKAGNVAIPDSIK